MDPLLLNRRSFLKLTTAAALTPSVQWAQPDFIVVGGGSSGAALVHRLSADPSLRILLLEAGVSGEQDPAVTSPGRWTSLIGSSYDWAYRTEPEAGMNGRHALESINVVGRDCPAQRRFGGWWRSERGQVAS